MLRITIKIRKDLNEDELKQEVCHKYHMNVSDIQYWKITRKSIDARNKDDVHYVYIIDVGINQEKKYIKMKNIQIIEKQWYLTYYHRTRETCRRTSKRY